MRFAGGGVKRGVGGGERQGTGLRNQVTGIRDQGWDTEIGR